MIESGNETCGPVDRGRNALRLRRIAKNGNGGITPAVAAIPSRRFTSLRAAKRRVTGSAIREHFWHLGLQTRLVLDGSLRSR